MDQPSHPHLETDPLKHSYYSTLPPTISKHFGNLDDSRHYEHCEQSLLSPHTRNFIVDFGGAPQDGGEAWCAVDVDDVEGVKQLLEAPRDVTIRTRWINIYNPYIQRELVAAITAYYGFSPRLTNVITTPPTKLQQPILNGRPASVRAIGVRARLRESARGWREYARGSSTDLEASSTGHLNARSSFQVPMRPLTPDGKDPDKGGSKPGGDAMGNYMDLAQKLWHWHAVEWGGQYICTGFNHLHNVQTAEQYELDQQTSPASFQTSRRHRLHKHLNRQDSSNSSKYDSTSDSDSDSSFSNTLSFDPPSSLHPYGRRVWTWLTLCDDGTVISIHEPVTSISSSDLELIRLNSFSTFRSLSLSPHALRSANSHIGPGLDELPFRISREFSTVDGGPSLLFYYLFDDWHSTFRFVYELGAPYSTKMSELRDSMRRNPHLKHLKKLHRITRRLAVLKRMMETRKIIVENILYRQEKPTLTTDPFFSPHRRSVSITGGGFGSDSLGSRPPPLTSMGHPALPSLLLSTLAIPKFERLRDRISLYVLGELDSLLIEKTELENLTYNLISLRQSETVELLTRVTIWLTKFTFLFMPLSLVTGYFGMDSLRGWDGKYTEVAFWGAVGVCLVITVGVLWAVTWKGQGEGPGGWGGWGGRVRVGRKEKRK